MNIITFESDPPQTPFAPYWKWYLAEFENIAPTEYFSKLASVILEKEHQIIDNNSSEYLIYNEENNIVFDGDTGLGPDSITSRSPFYNLLSWPETQILKELILENYTHFLNALNIPRRKTWIQCWCNVMRNGESIKQHIHASHPLTWLGGHITVACNNTSTYYTNPVMRAEGKQVYQSKNNVGQLTLFQDNIPHYTDTHIGSSERISIAFDIVVDERLSSYSQQRQSNFILFDDV